MLTQIQERAKSLRSVVYDFLVGATTAAWYREVLLECPVNCSMLDVGIGTAASLISNRDIVLSKRMSVIGVDCDADYVHSAHANLAASSLCDVVRVEHANIHEYNKAHSEKFDIIYFSGSFMIIPDQSEALRHCVQRLRSRVSKVPRGCNIFFTQTFEEPTFIGKYITPFFKRALRFVTTIDFGEVTFEAEFRDALRRGGVEIVDTKSLHASYFRTQKLVMARPIIGMEE